MSDNSFREHVPVGEKNPGDSRRELPEDVGTIADPSDGRRYLYSRHGGSGTELLVPLADAPDVQEWLIANGSSVRRRTGTEPGGAGAPTGSSADGDDIGPEKRELLALKAADQLRIMNLALGEAEMAALVVEDRPFPPEMSTKRDIATIVDLVRGDADPGPGASATPGAATSPGWDCWPHHVLTCQEYPEWGPGGPVTPLPDFVPPPLQGDAGRGVTIAVVDTGVSIRHAMLDGRVRSRGLVDAERLDRDRDQRLDLAAGHGTFIAGIIRQRAPGADLVIRSAAHPNGTAPDALVAGCLHTLLNEKRVDIVNLSLGGYVHKNEGNGLPLTTHALQRLRAKWPRIIVVAAAGNDKLSTPFFPAALPYVIGVGALDGEAQRAPFSNFGPWVDMWAPGVDLESSWTGPDISLPDGGGTGREGARWSGTSFATPMVVGALAAAMSPGSGA